MSESEQLLQDLSNPDISIRKKATMIVGDKKIAQAVPTLINLLANDPDSVIRNTAARSLGKIADKAQIDITLDALTKSLEDSDYYVKTNACWSLGKLKDTRAIPILMKMVDPSMRVYTASGEAKSVQGQTGTAASENLRQEGVQYSDIIVKAIKAIEEIGNPDGIPALLKALDDEEDGTVRCAACLALGKIGDKSVVPKLIAALNDKYWYVRRDAAKALFKLKDPRAAATLASKLNDTYAEVRENCLKSLLEIGKPAGLEIFKAYIKDPKNTQFQAFISKNLTKEDLLSYLDIIINDENDPAKKQAFEKYRATLLAK